MNNKLDSFDVFVDDIISSDENLLKGELDILLMQCIFSSLELENFKNIDSDSKELKMYCINKISSSPFNKFSSEEIISSTKISKESNSLFIS